MTTAVGPEHVQPEPEPVPTDWHAYRMCPVCRAATGVPCVARSSRVVFGRTDGNTVTLPHPHTRRPMRSPRARRS